MIDPSTSIPDNPAIAHCMNVWKTAYQEGMAIRKEKLYANLYAGQAYRSALPPLTSLQNIRDFVACVAHGMLIGAIADRSATKLLYAAKVALATIITCPRRPGKEPHETPSGATSNVGEEQAA
jgi:hypothetical protein